MIHHGDLFDVLPTLPEASIDACITDAPYELGFMGKAWDRSGVAVQPETWRCVGRVLKPGAYLLSFGGTRTFHRIASAIEDAGFEIRDCLSWLYGSGFPKSLNLPGGRGTALKPGWEPIVLARKPLVGTVAANVEQFGTGALNIDACRVETTERLDPFGTPLKSTGGIHNIGDEPRTPFAQNALGRWPANVLLDEDAAALLDAQSGELSSGAKSLTAGDIDQSNWRAMEGRTDPRVRAKDSIYTASVGGASRFYYVAKPSREERDYGCQSLPVKSPMELTGRKEGSAGLKHGRAGTDRAASNFHPTVKPIELMRWLVRLVTPPGGTVLDPFTGSGTTGMACRYELRPFVGIEREADYVAIAERRIAAVAPLFGEQTA